MSKEFILEVKNITKVYKTYKSELRRILSWFGLGFKSVSQICTLEDITFSIQPGEAVGIIGQNGAGKSTLLKIITGTLKPTQGSVTCKGRIAAILELGMGFHPDLTGRQNAYHSAGLMGYSLEQIDTVISDIESFSEIADYFDKPVRLYSSGMQMRVAFSVATAFRPEILIIDEALSVGDTYFQHKSFERIRRYRDSGTSLLFVSHDKGAILALCDRAILLEKGHLLKDGNPEEVTDYYNALIAQKENSTISLHTQEDGKVKTTCGTGEAVLNEIGLYNEAGDKVETVGVGDLVELRIKIKAQSDLHSLVLGYGIKDRLGQVLFGTNTWLMKQVLHDVKNGEYYSFTIAFPANFGEGSYSVQTALVDRDTHLTSNYEWQDMALVFNVVNIDKNHFVGLSWNEPKITIRREV